MSKSENTIVETIRNLHEKLAEQGFRSGKLELVLDDIRDYNLLLGFAGDSTVGLKSPTYTHPWEAHVHGPAGVVVVRLKREKESTT